MGPLCPWFEVSNPPLLGLARGGAQAKEDRDVVEGVEEEPEGVSGPPLPAKVIVLCRRRGVMSRRSTSP